MHPQCVFYNSDITAVIIHINMLKHTADKELLKAHKPSLNSFINLYLNNLFYVQIY